MRVSHRRIVGRAGFCSVNKRRLGAGRLLGKRQKLVAFWYDPLRTAQRGSNDFVVVGHESQETTLAEAFSKFS